MQVVNLLPHKIIFDQLKNFRCIYLLPHHVKFSWAWKIQRINACTLHIFPDNNVIFGLLLLAAATNISVSILVLLLLVLSHPCHIYLSIYLSIYWQLFVCINLKSIIRVGGSERFGFARRKMWNWNPQVWQAHQYRLNQAAKGEGEEDIR